MTKKLTEMTLEERMEFANNATEFRINKTPEEIERRKKALDDQPKLPLKEMHRNHRRLRLLGHYQRKHGLINASVDLRSTPEEIEEMWEEQRRNPRDRTKPPKGPFAKRTPEEQAALEEEWRLDEEWLKGVLENLGLPFKGV